MNFFCGGLLSFILLARIIAQPALGPSGPRADATPPASPPFLSPATREKIARMTPLFDGTSLEGWVQIPAAALTFASNDFAGLPALTKKLAEKSDPVSAYLAAQLDVPGQVALAGHASTGGDAKALTSALLRNLNRVVAGPAVFEPARFRGVALRPDTEALRQRNPQGLDLMRLNRVLLEDAFPRELSRSPATCWVAKDGAMASTGSGRGVIFTQGDYTHYRLIFTMRHVAGKPDHHPCILVFGTRPPPGERGLDALGGIQFQAPNGGHWDYRPGQNNAGTGFTNPVKTRHDNHEWCQVELLVDARNGAARMAVAVPVGTQAIENLVFLDPAAGRPGPIAWQMHNAGLFDEFRDIRIEVDPAEDWLITVK